MLQSQPLLFRGSLSSTTLLWDKRWSEESQKEEQEENHLGINFRKPLASLCLP